ncbi:MAG: hypothetical protein KDD37_04595 [Bdellovibrionales bacterium]|nr:hypothetical protein [Bdellovibrionales bacterium]
MNKIFIGTCFMIALHFFFNDFAYAEQSGVKNSISLRAWTPESLVSQMLKETKVLNTFTNSLQSNVLRDDQFKNLSAIKVQSILEGDSEDQVMVRFSAIDGFWPQVGTIVFDAEVRSMTNGSILSATVTSWTIENPGQRGYNNNGPHYDLPRAIIIVR